MWTHPSRQQVPKTHSTLHNFLCQQPFLVLTPPPFSLNHDPNTYMFMCNISMSFLRRMSAKMPISTQNQKKGEERGGELQPNDQNNPYPNLPHIPITPSLTPSYWYAQLSYPHPGSHTPWFQKHNPSRPQLERQTRDENEGKEVFFPPKKSQITNFLDLCVRRRKRHITTKK